MRVKTFKNELNNSSDEEQVNALRPVWQGRWFLVKTFTDKDIVVSEIEDVLNSEDIDS